MKIPEDLSYSDQHLWLRASDDGVWHVGITDYAQDMLGDIVFVHAPAAGSNISAGMPCGLVESVKTGSDLHAPLNGKVEAVNTTLESTPEQINDAPYATWIFKLRPTDPADVAKLLDAAAYRKLLAEN